MSAIIKHFSCQTKLSQGKKLFSRKRVKMGKFQNFELSAEQRAQQEIRNKQRLALRQQYWKNITDPKSHASGEGGHLFDPAMMRFQAMRTSHTDFFKPTPKSAFYGLGIIVIPLAILYTLVCKERTERERKFRSGEVSYRNREFKFI